MQRGQWPRARWPSGVYRGEQRASTHRAAPAPGEPPKKRRAPMSTLPPLIDPEALQRYLAERQPDGDAPLEIERIRGGHSNETFFVNRGPSRWVLRRPPRGPLMPTRHDVEPADRAMGALAATPAP